MSKKVKSWLVKECVKCNGFGGQLEDVTPEGDHVYSSLCVPCKGHGQLYREIVVIDEEGNVVDNSAVEDEFYGIEEKIDLGPADLCIPLF